MSEFINNVNAKLHLPHGLQNVEAQHRLRVLTLLYVGLYVYGAILFVFAALGIADILVIVLDGWVVLITVNLFWAATLLGIWWGLATNGASLLPWTLFQITVVTFVTAGILQHACFLTWYSSLEERLEAAKYFTIDNGTYLMREYSYFFGGVVLYFIIFTVCLLVDAMTIYYYALSKDGTADVPEQQRRQAP